MPKNRTRHSSLSLNTNLNILSRKNQRSNSNVYGNTNSSNNKLNYDYNFIEKEEKNQKGDIMEMLEKAKESKATYRAETKENKEIKNKSNKMLYKLSEFMINMGDKVKEERPQTKVELLQEKRELKLNINKETVYKKLDKLQNERKINEKRINEINKNTKDFKDNTYSKYTNKYIKETQTTKEAIAKEAKGSFLDSKRVKSNPKLLANNITEEKLQTKLTDELLSKNKRTSTYINFDDKIYKAPERTERVERTERAIAERIERADKSQTLRTERMNSLTAEHNKNTEPTGGYKKTRKLSEQFFSKYLKNNTKEDLNYLKKDSLNELLSTRATRVDLAPTKTVQGRKTIIDNYVSEFENPNQMKKEIDYLYPNQFNNFFEKRDETKYFKNNRLKQEKSSIMGENNSDKEYIRKKIDSQIFNKNKNSYLYSDHSGNSGSTLTGNSRTSSRINYIHSKMIDDKYGYRFEYAY